MTRIPCSATVDPLPHGFWKVTVTGAPPNTQSRVYTLEEKTDTLAAHEGLRRFVEEMEAGIT
jgi:hypothetical protein